MAKPIYRPSKGAWPSAGAPYMMQQARPSLPSPLPAPAPFPPQASFPSGQYNGPSAAPAPIQPPFAGPPSFAAPPAPAPQYAAPVNQLPLAAAPLPLAPTSQWSPPAGPAGVPDAALSPVGPPALSFAPPVYNGPSPSAGPIPADAFPAPTPLEAAPLPDAPPALPAPDMQVYHSPAAPQLPSPFPGEPVAHPVFAGPPAPDATGSYNGPAAAFQQQAPAFVPADVAAAQQQQSAPVYNGPLAPQQGPLPAFLPAPVQPIPAFLNNGPQQQYAAAPSFGPTGVTSPQQQFGAGPSYNPQTGAPLAGPSDSPFQQGPQQSLPVQQAPAQYMSLRTRG